MLKRLYFLSTLAIAFAVAGAAPASAQLSTSELLVRIDRLENQLRQMNGRVEQLEFRNRELETRMKRSQDDAEFRFKELEAKPGARPPAASPPANPPANPRRTEAPAAGDIPPVASAPDAPRRGEPPRNLGQLPPSSAPEATGEDEPDGAPLDLGTLSRQAQEDPRLVPPPAQPSDIITPSASPKDDYELSLAYLKRREYQLAEQGFRRFIQTYPRDRLVGDATFGLAEAFYGRAQYREAAENYLKVTTDYPRSGRGAESMLRLAMALNRLGEKDTACATFAAIGTKYPNAPNTKRRAEDEQKRAGCPT